MLQLDIDHLEAITRHAMTEYPRECCGILLGKHSEGVWRAERVLPARNLASAGIQDRYHMDPMDRLRAEAEAKREGLSVVGFYHSHPDHDVYFSKTDLENSEEYLMGEPWLEPTYAYFVLSVRDGQPRGFGAFRVEGGNSEQMRVIVA